MAEDAGAAGGFQIASAYVQVDPDAASFEESLDAQLGELNYVVKVPVVPDTGDFAGEVDAAVAESKAAVTVPVVPDAEDFAAKVDAAVGESKSAVEVPVNPNAAGFSERLAEEVDAAKATVEVPVVPDAAGFAEKTEADAAAAGEASGVAYSEKFAAAADSASLFPVAAAERDAETAGEESATGFGSRFASMLAGIPLFGGLFAGAETEAAEGGAAAGEGFMSRLTGVISGDMPVMEVLIGAGFIAATADMASKFQAAMELIHTQAGVAQSAISGLSSGVLSLAGQVGESPDSLAAALYHVESSFQSVGISGSKALQLVQIAAEGARTGNADLVDVTNALDATIVSGVGGIKNYSQAMGALNAIVGTGDMTMQDLADAMGTGLMAAGKAYGQSIYQIGAALATFGDNNIRGAKAATDLRMAWQAIEAPMKTGIGTLNELGLTQDQLANEMTQHGLTAALQMFVQHLEASKVPIDQWGEYMTEIFGKRAGVGIQVLVDQLSRLQGKLPDIEQAANNFGNAWTATTQTANQRLKDLESGAEALMIKIGDGLLPSVSAFMAMIVRNLPAIEHFGEGIARLAAPVVESFFTGLDAILKVLFGPLRDVTLAVGGLTVAFLALDAVNPFIGITAALIALVGAIIKYHEQISDTIHKYWREIEIFMAGIALAVPFVAVVAAVIKYHEQIFDAVTTTWKNIIGFLSSVEDEITGGFDAWWKSHGQEIDDVWKAVWTTVTDVFQVEWTAFMAVAKPAFGVFEDMFTFTLGVISDAWKAAWGAISTVFTVTWDGIETAVKVVWDIIVGTFNISLDLITGHWSQAMTDAQNSATQVWNAIKQYFQGWWNDFTNLVTQQLDVLKNLLASAWNTVKSVAETTWNGIQQYFTSMWHTIESLFSSAVASIKTTLLSGWDGMKSDASAVWGTITSYFKTVWSGMELGFQNAVNAIKTVWSTLQAIFEAPVKFLVNTVYDNGIARLWNDVAGAIPGIPKLPIVSFAAGGKVTEGSGPRSDDVLARVSRGETVVSAAHSQLLAPVFAAVGVPGYAAGGAPAGVGAGLSGHASSPGILGGIGSAVSAVGGAIGDAVDVGKLVAAIMTGNTTAFSNALNALVTTDTSGELASMMTGIPKTLIKDSLSGIASAVSKAVNAAKSAIGMAGIPNSSGLAALKAAAAAHGWTGAQLTALEEVEEREAGFSLTAQNPTSGAYGMAQFISGPSEYAQYGGNATTYAGQATAMANYIAQRYGTPEAAEAHEVEYGWYANGGYLGPGQFGVVGEAGPEIIQGGRTGATITPMGGAQRPVININYFGPQNPTAEMEQAMMMRISAAVGVS